MYADMLEYSIRTCPQKRTRCHVPMAARYQKSPVLNTCESPPASQEKNKHEVGIAEIPAQHLVWIPRNSQPTPHLLKLLAIKRTNMQRGRRGCQPSNCCKIRAILSPHSRMFPAALHQPTRMRGLQMTPFRTVIIPSKNAIPIRRMTAACYGDVTTQSPGALRCKTTCLLASFSTVIRTECSISCI